MRIIVILAALLIAAAIVPGRIAADDSPIKWQPLFAETDLSTDDGLILILVTNDLSKPTTKESDQQSDSDVDQSELWCAGLLQNACKDLIADDFIETSAFSIQSVAAGLPPELTGGIALRNPRRALIAVCDHQFRFLSLAVGVPQSDELKLLLSDAHEVRSMLDQFSDDPATIRTLVADRNRSRVGRIWQEVLQTRLANDFEDATVDTITATDDRRMRREIHSLYADLHPIYQQEIQQRLRLTPNSDAVRIAILEQHLQTRRDWSAVAMPFLAGSDFRSNWRTVVEAVWGHPPITPRNEPGQWPTDWAEWFAANHATEGVIFQIESTLAWEHILWPPPDDGQRKRRGTSWAEVHRVAQSLPFRRIDWQTTTDLIRHFELSPIDLYLATSGPSPPPRYLFIGAEKNHFHVFRDADPPSRLAGMLKRSKARLVAK